MRKGQGLPVNMIVLTALALLVLVVVGAFFISGFGQASSSVNVVNATQADCQNKCQGLTSVAFNYNECDTLKTQVGQAAEYMTQCSDQFGACTVTLRNGAPCEIKEEPAAP